MKDPRSKIGAASELKAAAHFMHQGFHVSRSLDPQCPFDLVITNNKGESCLIDVKTLNKRRDGSRINRTTTKAQKKMGIEIYEVE
jgi:Holliday junction resolvase-like predicted endonuclease|tara:strand:- start:60 stop:314 length:255 start_codon:yes stop_codon:yes gene_type:complete